MPNHVSNIVQLPTEVAETILTTYTEGSHAGERGVDFELIIPMPHHTNPIFTATRSDLGNGMVGYGIDGYSPLDWASDHWGTKWNAYDCDISDVGDGITRLSFDTAWGHPAPVITRLSRTHPNVTFEVEFADEDLGYNVGRYKIRDGNLSDENFPEGGTDEARDMAAQIKYGCSYAALGYDEED